MAERDQAATRVAAPLLDHPVVVGLDARQPEVLVGAFEERLAAEARQRREAHRRFDPAHVHVGEARRRVVATRAHVVVGDRSERHLLFRVADGGDHALVRVHEVFVEPAVDLGGRVVVEVLDVAGGARRSRSRGCRGAPPWGRDRGTRPASQRSHTCGGSTTWSSTLTSFGISCRSWVTIVGGFALPRVPSSTRGHVVAALRARALTVSQSARLARAASPLSFHGAGRGRGDLEPHTVRVVEVDAVDDLVIDGPEHFDAVRAEPLVPPIDDPRRCRPAARGAGTCRTPGCGGGSSGGSSGASKKAMVEPSAIRKNEWKYGTGSPVDGIESSSTALTSSMPRIRV